MRAGFDSDGCIDTFGDGVHEALIARGQGHLWKSGPTPHAIWNFYEEWPGWDFPKFKELVDWGVDHGYIFSGHWRPKALESIKRIASLGHEIIIITDRSWGSDPKNSERNTIEAFARAGIEYDELHFTADKTSVPVDVMVEDRIENYDALIKAGTPTWLINRGWNVVDGGDARNRINCVCEYADAVEEMTREGFYDLTFA
jgi:hypothetical protein